MHPLTEKIAFVTGAAQGIGHGIALELAKAGADVIVADIQESGVTASAAEISALGRRALPLCFDLTDADSVVAAAGTAVARFGRIDILVNNAGVVQKRAGLETSTEDFDLCQTVNVNTVWSMSQAVIPHFRSRRSGKIVNIASVAGRRGWMETPAYAASKAAILNLTQSLALALAPDNINVNAICPGLIDTAMMTEIRTALGNREGDEAFKSAIVSKYSAQAPDNAGGCRSRRRLLCIRRRTEYHRTSIERRWRDADELKGLRDVISVLASRFRTNKFGDKDGRSSVHGRRH